MIKTKQHVDYPVQDQSDAEDKEEDEEYEEEKQQ